MYPLRVFRVYNKVADSGGVAIQEQGSSTFDTHEPAIAILLSPFCFHPVDSFPHKNQIFLGGRHQEVRRFVSPDLHHITSFSSHYGMSRNQRHTSTSFRSVLPSLTTILCHKQAIRMVIYWDRYPMVARKWWRGGGSTGVWWGLGDLMRGTPFS